MPRARARRDILEPSVYRLDGEARRVKNTSRRRISRETGIGNQATEESGLVVARVDQQERSACGRRGRSPDTRQATRWASAVAVASGAVRIPVGTLSGAIVFVNRGSQRRRDVAERQERQEHHESLEELLDQDSIDIAPEPASTQRVAALPRDFCGSRHGPRERAMSHGRRRVEVVGLASRTQWGALLASPSGPCDVGSSRGRSAAHSSLCPSRSLADARHARALARTFLAVAVGTGEGVGTQHLALRLRQG